MKRKDFLLIALVLALAAALYGGARLLSRGEVDEVIVRVDGTDVLRVPLDTDGVYSVPLPEGEVNIIAVEKGGVRMQEANCRDGLCMLQGVTRSAGKQIVCLPHRVLVYLQRAQSAQDSADDLDAVVR